MYMYTHIFINFTLPAIVFTLFNVQSHYTCTMHSVHVLVHVYTCNSKIRYVLYRNGMVFLYPTAHDCLVHVPSQEGSRRHVSDLSGNEPGSGCLPPELRLRAGRGGRWPWTPPPPAALDLEGPCPPPPEWRT